MVFYQCGNNSLSTRLFDSYYIKDCYHIGTKFDTFARIINNHVDLRAVQQYMQQERNINFNYNYPTYSLITV